jgi:uncharacterized protein
VQQWGMGLGIGATVCLVPGAVTSFDGAVRYLGIGLWRRLHLLAVPALVLTGLHALLLGSSYLGSLVLTPWHLVRMGVLALGLLGVLLLRSAWIWKIIGLENRYGRPKV